MKRGPKIAAWIGGVLAALIVVLVLVVAFFDWNRLKPFINDKVSQAIGRPFAINGDLAVHWKRDASGGWLASIVPWPQFTAKDISVANPGWAKRPKFATLDGLQFRLSPLALLAHRISVPSLQLVQPSIDLERDKKGQATWDFTLPKSADNAPSAWTLNLGALGFDTGTVNLDDAANNVTLKVAIKPLEKAIPYADLVAQTTASARQQAGKSAGSAATKKLSTSGKDSSKAVAGSANGNTRYQFGWQVDGSYQGATIKGSGKTGAVLALQTSDRPFPVQADVRIGDSHIALVGTLTDPVHLGALDVKLWFSGSSMAKLYPLTGITLPDTPPYATEGHLKASLGRDHSRFSYDNFHGRVGGSDLNGDLLFVTGAPRPKLSGDLHAKLLQFSDLAPLIGADSNAEKKQRGDGTLQPADKVLPVEPFRTERWKAMDADVTFASDRISHGEALPISSLKTHLVMDNGKLSLDPLNFGLAGGTMKNAIHLDGSNEPMRGSLDLDARHLKLKQLFPTFQPMKTSFGEINADATIKATGNSVAALLGSSDGEVKMLMNDGAISKSLLELAGLNVGNYIAGKLFGDETVQINCAAVDMTADSGLYTSKLFVFDTKDAVIRVDGTVNFANEKLDLDITPKTKGFRIFSLRSPLYVHGTFKDPSPGVHAGPLALRAGGAVALGVVAAPAAALLALVAPQGDTPQNTCQTVLSKLRTTGEIDAPPATARKGKPAGKEK